MNENEYMDRTKWSDKDLLETYNMEDYPYEKGQAMKAAILSRMGIAPQASIVPDDGCGNPIAQDDEWEERVLHNEIIMDGDMYYAINGVKVLVPEYLLGKNSESYICRFIRRVPKKKPYSDHASEPVDTSNDLPKIAVCPTCGTALGVEEEKPPVRFAIAGTPDAELPGVVALELIYDLDGIVLRCKDRELGYLLVIDNQTGATRRSLYINPSIGFPLDDRGRLVIE